MQPGPLTEMSSECIGWGDTFTRDALGATPVTWPDPSTGKTTCDMNTFQTWLACVLGATTMFEPYQTMSARPGPPALIQGKTFTASPVMVDPSLTWNGALKDVHPVARLATLTKTWRRA